MKRFLLWGVPAIAYAAFCWWYTNTEGPLTAEEVEHFVAAYETANPGERSAERFRAFLSDDSGRQFIMVNALDLAEDSPHVPGANPGESAAQLLGRYMEYMYPALLRRACHPVYAGRAIAPAMDVVGVGNAEQWTTGALMRYRSRRDLAEIATNPEFAGRHAFKIAALERTLAFPVENTLYLSDARLLLGLVLFSFAAALHLLLLRRG